MEARLIDDLLDLTRIAHGKLILDREICDMHDLLRQAIETCCHPEVISGKLQIQILPEATEHHTFGDPARIQQIFWNLLNNAVKFTPEAGHIIVATQNRPPGRIEISVSDTGIGLNANSIPRLFNAFQQADAATTRQFGGLGLGLAICKALTELHGGSISAESAGYKKGATFKVSLNAVAAPQKSPALAPNAPNTPPCRCFLRILLAEDHEPTRQILAKLLTGSGHQVYAAGTVAGALQIAAEHPIDLLVSDVGLPDASGMDLMRKLNSLYHVPGIALSGYGMEEDIRASKDAGFAAHLIKPVDWKRLEMTLSQFVQRFQTG